MSADDCAVADGDAVEHCCACADPDVFADGDACAFFHALTDDRLVGIVETVVSGADIAVGSDESASADGDVALCCDAAVGTDVYAVAEFDACFFGDDAGVAADDDSVAEGDFCVGV